jgi:hypothetical protein
MPELSTRGGKVRVRPVWVCRGEWGGNGAPCSRCRGEACAPRGGGQGRRRVVVNRGKGVQGLWDACTAGCGCRTCARFSVLGSTSRVRCCSSTRADSPTVGVCKFDVRLLVVEFADACCCWRFRCAGSGSLPALCGTHALSSIGPH